jgi:hypothetical protein
MQTLWRAIPVVFAERACSTDHLPCYRSAVQGGHVRPEQALRVTCCTGHVRELFNLFSPFFRPAALLVLRATVAPLQ